MATIIGTDYGSEDNLGLQPEDRVYLPTRPDPDPLKLKLARPRPCEENLHPYHQYVSIMYNLLL